MQAQWYDANIALPGCDKNMPGGLIAMARVNRPALMVYGGTIRAGDLDGQPLDIVSAFQSYGEYPSARRKAWSAPPNKATRGTLFKYIKNVKSASEGCVTDE